MTLRVVTEYDAATNSWSSYCPELPGLASCGFTKDEALENFHEAAELYFEPDDISVPEKAEVVEMVL